MLDTLTQAEAFRLLCLQAEWGADEAIEPAPVARLHRPDASSPTEVQPRPARAGAPAARAHPPAARAVPAGAAFAAPPERALTAASGAATLEELRAALDAFDGCALRDTASHLVFAEGDPAASLLLIGEPPGRDEDRGGHPFAGAEGQLLDQMLASIGLNRARLMLTHVVPWRPPGGRPANPSELAVCLPFLHRLVVLLRPRRLLLLGGTAARALLSAGLPPGSPLPSVRKRGVRTWTEVTIPGHPATVPALSLPSLADLTRTPALKREAWAGLRLLRRTLDTDLT